MQLPHRENDAALTADYTALVWAHQGTSVPVRPGHDWPWWASSWTLSQTILRAYAKAVGQSGGLPSRI